MLIPIPKNRDPLGSFVKDNWTLRTKKHVIRKIKRYRVTNGVENLGIIRKYTLFYFCSTLVILFGSVHRIFVFA